MPPDVTCCAKLQLLDSRVVYRAHKTGVVLWLSLGAAFGGIFSLVALASTILGILGNSGPEWWQVAVLWAGGCWFLFATLVWIRFEVVLEPDPGTLTFRSVLARRRIAIGSLNRVSRAWSDNYCAVFAFQHGSVRVLKGTDGFDDLLGYLRIVKPDLEVTGF